MELKGDYFNQHFHNPTSKADETFNKHCPADIKKQLWQGHAYHGHIPKVVESSIQGFKTWRRTHFTDRINLLQRFQEVVRNREQEIAHIIALETGKPLWESTTEAQALVGKVDVTLNESLARIKTKKYDNIMPSLNAKVFYRPLGPCLIIGPFNFPCHLANGQILSALMAGNSIIFKPSEKTMMSGQILIECFDRAGFPEGVINLIQGASHTSSQLVDEPSIKGIFFTGSKAVGQIIAKQTAGQLDKLVALELGGKNATIIHHDYAPEHTLAEVLKASYLTTGQRCTSTSNIFVHQQIYEHFKENLVKVAKKIIVDHPIHYSSQPFMGPLIDQHALEKYQQYCELAASEGQTLLNIKDPLVKNYQGHYVGPSIFAIENPQKNTQSLKEEVFGPSCNIIPYKNLEQAVSLANDNEYGLAASVFTQDAEVFDYCQHELEAGLINLNRSTVGASAKLPFGGVKNSGNFRPAAVSMIDHCVSTHSSLETLSETHSSLNDIVGLEG